VKLLVIDQHRPSLNVIDIVPAKELEFVEVQWVLDGIHVVIVQDIASMVVGQDCLATRAILQKLAHARHIPRMDMTYDVIVATIDDVPTTILEIYTVAVDKRSCG
jgi:hypothetical protein